MHPAVLENAMTEVLDERATGRSTDKVFDSINEVEARKKVMVKELSTLDSLNQVVSLDAKALRKSSGAV